MAAFSLWCARARRIRPGGIAVVIAAALLCTACASRPVNPPISQVDHLAGYRFVARTQHGKDKKENVVILAFSGGGARAAAFSYGVLEALRSIEVIGPTGGRIRMLDEVDVITGVSGGSFTALAYGLYGEKLFELYESAFLKRDVQGELIRRVLNPANWGQWSRSEVAATLYDEILFHGATFADLDRGAGPFIGASATDISTGARFSFHQGVFDMLCSDLGPVRLSRAAAASSAVPFALSPVTFNNYGGTCDYALPPFLQAFSDPSTAPRPVSRLLTLLQGMQSFKDGVKRPYVHVVDGGLSDNLGMRGVLEALETLEALNSVDLPSPLDDARRIVMFVVNSRPARDTNWGEVEDSPGAISLLNRASRVPIDHYSYDTVESVRDIAARWHTMRQLRESAAFAANRDPAIAQLMRAPNAELYVIDVSFPRLEDAVERDYLTRLPTALSLPPEAIDRLRAAAGKIIRDSPDFKRLLRDARASVADGPRTPPAPVPANTH